MCFGKNIKVVGGKIVDEYSQVGVQVVSQAFNEAEGQVIRAKHCANKQMEVSR